MLELNVAPSLRDLLPAISMEFPDELLARHRRHTSSYTLSVYRATITQSHRSQHSTPSGLAASAGTGRATELLQSGERPWSDVAAATLVPSPASPNTIRGARIMKPFPFLSLILVAASCSSLGGVSGEDEVCSASQACETGLECVGAVDGDESRCRVPEAGLNSCCFGTNEDTGRCLGGDDDVDAATAETDGCAEGLTCIKGFMISGDFQPDDPVCVHPDNRVEGERCENDDALCGEGMICSFSGTCVVRECNVDEDCAEGLVCHLPDLRRAQARAHRRRGWARRVSSLRATRATAASR